MNSNRTSALRGKLRLLALGLLLAAPAGSSAQLIPPEELFELPPFTVLQERTPGEAAALPLGGVAFDRAVLEPREVLAVDDFLRQVPGFSLFRRTSSRVANPTTQGATLRGIGPSGAGRALVLLDGVPLNDPFGGWVHWGRLDLAELDRIEVLRGGGSSAWGSAALGGVVHLHTRLPPPARRLSARAGAEFGTRQTRRYRGAVGSAGEAWSFSLGARHFETGGYVRVVPEAAGAVDIPATSRHQLYRAGGEWRITPQTQVSARTSYFTEDRGNGTPLTSNSTSAFRGQLGLKQETGPITWQMDGFVDRTIYASTFSSVGADRAGESLVLDQFRVPGHSGGIGLVAGGSLGPAGTWSLGSDWRIVRGETREWVIFPNQIRIAGGRQRNIGLFGDTAYRLGAWELSGALRFDDWRDDRGSLRLASRASGEIIRHDSFEPAGQRVWSPRVGVRWLPRPELTLRSAAYSGFRMPTLNERYRPFQVGSDRTFANEGLRAETLRGAEVGADFSFSGRHRASLTLFYSELRDAIANVSIGPNPLGGEDRQRRNLAVLANTGLELEWIRQLSSALRLSAAYAWTDARISRAPEAPHLEDRRTPQTARHGFSLETRWRFITSTELTLTGRYQSSIFEDDLNSRRLGGYFVSDLHLVHRLGRTAGDVFVSAENFLDRRYLDGWTGATLRTQGSPRWINAGWRGEF